MRIRKHASKILGIASTLQSPPSPPLVVADPIPTAYVCTLNQSPWDVYPFHHLTPPPSDDKQEKGYVGDEINGEEPMFVVTSAAAVLKDEALVPWSREESKDMEEMEEESDPVLALNKVKKVKGKRVSEKNAKEDSWSTARDGAPSTFTCKKTDGKQWRCKRPSSEPNSLCDYHLAQIKSYNCKSPSPPVAKATSIGKSTRRKRVTMPPATSVVSDIYYYSSFGPWRGKQRGGSEISKHQLMGAAAKEEFNGEQKSCNVDVSADDESYKDSEMEVKQMRKDSEMKMKQMRNDTAINGKKKRRKPLKVRSLESLM